MPSFLQISMSLLSAPREIQWQRAASASISGEASSLIPMATTSMPAWRAASSASTGKRPLPAIIPKGEPNGGILFDEPALRRRDEFQQLVHFGRGWNLFADALDGLRGVESGASQQPK